MAAVTVLFLITQALLLVSHTHGVCSPVISIPHGKVTYDSSYRFYQVSCNPGYILHGNHRVDCERGEWNILPPTCIENESTVCEELPAPENGELECGNGPITLGRSCRLKCNQGYELKGSETRICMLEKQWSGIETKCIPVTRTFCPLPDPLIHGSVIGCSSQDMPRINGKCRFQCNSGYVLKGPSSLICSPSGGYVDEEGNENFPECVVDNDYRNYAKPHPNYNYRSTSRLNEQSASTEMDHNSCRSLRCQHICKNEDGRVWCRCRKGFTLASDQKSCIETSPLDPLQTHSESTSLSDPHRGVYNGKVSSYDGSRSRNNNGLCYNHQCEHICRIEKGRAQCRCRKGFILNKEDQRSCDQNLGPPVRPPLNPCEYNNGGCEHSCELEGTYRVSCKCYPGYHLATDGKSCIAVETRRPIVTCEVNNGGCEHSCTMRGYTVICSCPRGYNLDTDGKHCIAIETRRPVVTCDINNGGCEHSCTMRRYTAVCSCPRGYKLDTDGKHCIDIDECKDERLNSCQHYCENTEGSYICRCQPGYVMIENHKCEGCRKHSYWSTVKNGCVDCPPNSFTEAEGRTSIHECICYPGFTGSPKVNTPCLDIDECAVGNFGCSDMCVNTPGGAFCSCPSGYTVDKDNKTCIDIDECSIKNGGCEGHCFNNDGSFECKCPAGYVSSNKDKYSCDDVDECLENNGGCQQLCVNYRGGYHCTCEKGYRLDISLKNCTDITCPALPIPHFSTMTCKKNGGRLEESDNYPTGTLCTFRCLSGFKDTSESNKMKCQQDGTWKGSLSECKSQRCPALDVPENGDIHPASCSTAGNTVKQKCTFTCHRGYKLKGFSIFNCKNDLTWNPVTNNTPVCEPEEIRASMECTRSITVTLLPGTSSHNVTLPEPVTNMDSYNIYPANISVGKPIEFKAGVTRVAFTASSPSSNRTAKCVTTVRVVDKEPPVFLSCPEPIVIEDAKIDGETVTWEEPEVIDNVNVESVKSSVEPNTTLIPGSYVVEYIARDPAGNTADCSFKIDIVRLSCDNLTDPAHGEANCMDWLYGNLCQPICDEGYMRNPSDPMFYSCGDSGVWEPSSTISDCLPYTEAISSDCPEGSELKIIEETDEEICLECSPVTVWSSTTRTCEKTTI